MLSTWKNRTHMHKIYQKFEQVKNLAIHNGGALEIVIHPIYVVFYINN